MKSAYDIVKAPILTEKSYDYICRTEGGGVATFMARP